MAIDVIASRYWLDYENYNVVVHGVGTGKSGQWKRQPGVGYVDETLALFDFEAMGIAPGFTYNGSASYFEFSYTGTGSNVSGNMYICEQRRRLRDQWNLPPWGARDPRFDDFPAVDVAWSSDSNILQGVGINTLNNGSGRHYLSDSNDIFKQLVDSWIAKTKNPMDGIIFETEFGATSATLTITEAKFHFEAAAGSNLDFNDYQLRRHR